MDWTSRTCWLNWRVKNQLLFQNWSCFLLTWLQKKWTWKTKDWLKTQWDHVFSYSVPTNSKEPASAGSHMNPLELWQVTETLETEWPQIFEELWYYNRTEGPDCGLWTLGPVGWSWLQPGAQKGKPARCLPPHKPLVAQVVAFKQDFPANFFLLCFLNHFHGDWPRSESFLPHCSPTSLLKYFLHV